MKYLRFVGAAVPFIAFNFALANLVAADEAAKTQPNVIIIYGGKQANFALYNLAKDIGEQQDVAAENPEVVKQMGDLLLKIRGGEGVREVVAEAVQR